jgi:hypothetical protein
MGYFMTHLLMLGKIRDIPLYELDAMELRNKSNAAFPFTLFTLAVYNLSLITGRIPNKAFAECGIDVNRWYPLPRRVVDTAHFMVASRRERERQRHVLDTVRERFDVRCGPLVHAAREVSR